MKNKDPNEKKKVLFLILSAGAGMSLIPIVFTYFSTISVYLKVVTLVIGEACIFASGFIARSIKLDSDDEPKEGLIKPEEKEKIELKEESKSGN